VDCATASFFDCHARIGRPTTPHRTNLETAEALVEQMDYFGIAEALVYHAGSVDWDPAKGNEMLAEELAGQERLHGCAVLLPSATREMGNGDPAAYLAALGMRAVRLFPKQHSYRLTEWCAGRVLASLEESGMVLLLDVAQVTWDELAELLRGHPRLPVILLEPFYRTDRYLYALWEQFDNLYVETATYQTHRGIESVCARFGPERLIFGTGLPVRDGGGAITPILLAEVPEASKQAIAGGTLRRLLGRGE